jgi:hypothetical protein
MSCELNSNQAILFLSFLLLFLIMSTVRVNPFFFVYYLKKNINRKYQTHAIDIKSFHLNHIYISFSLI